MPNIQTYQSNAGIPEPVLTQVSQSPVASAINDMLEVVRQKAEQDKQVKEKQWVINKAIDFKTMQLQKQHDLEMNAAPGADGHAQLVSEQYDKDANDYISSNDAPSEIAREQLRTHLSQFGLDVKSDALRFQESESSRYAHENVISNVNTLGNRLVSRPDTYSDAVSDMSALVDSLNGKIPQEKILEIKRDALGVLNWSASTGRINQNPYAELNNLKSGALDAMFDIQKKTSLINAAESEIRSREAAAEAAQAAQYSMKLSDLELSARYGDLKVPQVEGMYYADKLKPNDRVSLINIIMSREKEGQKQANYLSLGNAALSEQVHLNPFDSEHRKAIDATSQAIVSNMTQNGKSPVDIMSALEGVSVKTGVVPDVYKNYVEGNVMQLSDPHSAVVASSSMINTITKNPVASVQFNDKVLARANLIQTLNTIYPPQEAVIKANELFTQDESVKQERHTQINEYEKTQKKSDKTFDYGFTKWYGDKFDTGIFDVSTSPAASGLRQKYVDMVKTEYQLSGNIDSAVATVQGKFGAQIGYSSVGGERVLMEKPPEVFYGLPKVPSDDNAKWQAAQAKDFVLKQGFDPDYQRLIITQHPTKKMGPDGMPNYAIQVVLNNGQMIPLRENNGSLKIWRPDPNAEHVKRVDQMQNQPAMIERIGISPAGQ